MLTIKAEYKGLLANLGKNIQSLADIARQLQVRFPENFPTHLEYYVDGQIINSYDDLIGIAQKEGKKAVKVKAVPTLNQGSTLKKQEEQIAAEEIDPRDASEIKFLEIETQEREKNQQNYYQLPEMERARRENQELQARFEDETAAIRREQEQMEAYETQRKELEKQNATETLRKLLEKKRIIFEKNQAERIRMEWEENAKKLAEEEEMRRIQEEEMRKMKEEEEMRKMKEEEEMRRMKEEELKACLERETKEQASKLQISSKVESFNMREPSQLASKIDLEKQNSSSVLSYPCFKCEGNGLVTIGQQKFICDTCEGKGGFAEDSKFVTFLDKFILDRLNKYRPILSVHPLNSVPELVPQEKKKIVKEARFEAKIQQVLLPMKKCYEAEIGQNVFQSFTITNVGKQEWPELVEVYDMGSHEVKGISGLKPGQSRTLNFGPFTRNEAGRLEKTYFLSYLTCSNRVFFGNKFGFIYNFNKPVETKRINQAVLFENRIQRIMKSLNMGQVVSKVLEGLNIMGINETSESLDDEILKDIIKGI